MLDLLPPVMMLGNALIANTFFLLPDGLSLPTLLPTVTISCVCLVEERLGRLLHELLQKPVVQLECEEPFWLGRRNGRMKYVS